MQCLDGYKCHAVSQANINFYIYQYQATPIKCLDLEGDEKCSQIKLETGCILFFYFLQ